MTRSFLGQQCILEYFASQFQDLNPEISDAVVEELKNTLALFIKDAVPYNDCVSIFTEKLGTSSPLDMLKAVIDIDVTAHVENDSSSSESSSELSNTVSQSGRKRARPWNTEEDKRLLAGILRNGTDNWSLVAEIVGESRSRAQCSQRWFRGLDPRISKKRWSPDEDKKLLDFVEEYGETAWAKIANSMGNRSDVQCRYHYQQLKKSLRKPSKHTKSQHSSTKTNKMRDDKQMISLKPVNNYPTTIESPPLVEGIIKRALPPTQPLTLLSPLEPPYYLSQKMLGTDHNIDAFLNHFDY